MRAALLLVLLLLPILPSATGEVPPTATCERYESERLVDLGGSYLARTNLRCTWMVRYDRYTYEQDRWDYYQADAAAPNGLRSVLLMNYEAQLVEFPNGTVTLRHWWTWRAAGQEAVASYQHRTTDHEVTMCTVSVRHETVGGSAGTTTPFLPYCLPPRYFLP